MTKIAHRVAKKDSALAKSILVLNGPNLNLLGTREPLVYGAATLENVKNLCEEAAEPHISIDFRQSNHEGVLVDWIQEAGLNADKYTGIVMNPGAYTHTSIALRDAIAGIDLPVIEVHISNIHKREAFRHHSFISAVTQGTIVGLGIEGYALAIRALTKNC